MSTSSEKTVRLFIAANPGDTVRAELLRIQRELENSGLKAKWTSAETMHLTLVFFGSIPFARTGGIFQTLEKTAQKFPNIKSSLGAPGFFKKSGAAWIGLAAPPELFELQKELSVALGMEPKPFQPHFTLGRVKSGRGFQALEKITVEPVTFVIRSLELMQSELLSAGARHTVISQVFLQAHPF